MCKLNDATGEDLIIQSTLTTPRGVGTVPFAHLRSSGLGAIVMDWKPGAVSFTPRSTLLNM